MNKDEPFAVLICALGIVRLSLDDVAILLTALKLADESPADVSYRLVTWKIRTALGLETGVVTSEQENER